MVRTGAAAIVSVLTVLLSAETPSVLVSSAERSYSMFRVDHVVGFESVRRAAVVAISGVVIRWRPAVEIEGD
jgi:hypothetical protein